MKTYENWGKSNKDFDKFVNVGDSVDIEIYEYFLNVLPPLFYNGCFLQCSEACSMAYDYKKDKIRNTYTTFSKIGGDWVYMGECFYKEYEHKESKI